MVWCRKDICEYEHIFSSILISCWHPADFEAVWFYGHNPCKNWGETKNHKKTQTGSSQSRRPTALAQLFLQDSERRILSGHDFLYRTLTLMKYKIQSSVIVFGLLRELKLYNNFNNQPPIMFLLLYDKNVFTWLYQYVTLQSFAIKIKKIKKDFRIYFTTGIHCENMHKHNVPWMGGWLLINYVYFFLMIEP